MMENIEQNQVGKAAGAERQFIAVTDQIEPGVGKKVGADCLGQGRLQVADAGTDLNDATRQFPVE